MSHEESAPAVGRRDGAAPVAAGAPRAFGAQRPFALLMTLAGMIGWLASFLLTVEHWRVLQDASYVPACTVGEVVGCVTIMDSPQGNLLGFPNMLLGLGGFAAVAALGVALLTGARLHRVLWLSLWTVTLAGVVLVHWLAYQSVYVLGELCPYCMAVWVVTLALFWYLAPHLLARGAMRVPARLRGAVRASRELHGVILATWYAVFAVLIVTHFRFSG